MEDKKCNIVELSIKDFVLMKPEMISIFPLDIYLKSENYSVRVDLDKNNYEYLYKGYNGYSLIPSF